MERLMAPDWTCMQEFHFYSSVQYRTQKKIRKYIPDLFLYLKFYITAISFALDTITAFLTRFKRSTPSMY